MVYQGKMDLRKIKNSISLCIVKLKEDIYDIRYALVIITIYIIVTQIIFGSGEVFWISNFILHPMYRTYLITCICTRRCKKQKS